MSPGPCGFTINAVITRSEALMPVATSTPDAGMTSPLLSTRPARGWAIVRLLRPHHWVKNVLVLVPVFLAHQWNDPGVVRSALLAALCFCLVASAGYITNDLMDMHADRKHTEKRRRPIAAGEISTRGGVLIAFSLYTLGAILAVRLPLTFAAALLVYLLVSNLYSLYLKKKVLLDICTLAGLYTIRLFGGGAATGIRISEWTVAFAMFCFLGLAAVKRYSELRSLSPDLTSLDRRGYIPSDQSTVHILGLSSMMLAVLVLALYLHSPEVVVLYRHPDMLWLICPVLLYWFGRTWIIAGRGQMQSDPILFALSDRTSLFAAVLILAIGFLCK